MSQDLQWLLLRKNNSFIVKRVPEGPVFSKEPGNLRNIHSHKFSGLSNTKTIDIRDSGKGLTITTRNPNTESLQAVKSAKKTNNLKARTGGRRALGLTAQHAKGGYRPDLRTAALGRSSRLLATQREPKESPKKKLRGKRAAISPKEDDIPQLE